MPDRPGHLWTLIQDWLDTFRYGAPSQRKLADLLKVSNSTLGDYKYARSMPPPVFVVRLAVEMQVPYERVLDAVLQDRGYRGDTLTYLQALVSSEMGGSSGGGAGAGGSAGDSGDVDGSSDRTG